MIDIRVPSSMTSIQTCLTLQPLLYRTSVRHPTVGPLRKVDYPECHWRHTQTRNQVLVHSRYLRSTPKNHLPYPSASMHLSAVNTQVRRLSTDQNLPITREEIAILREILPTWEVPGMLIPYPERVLVVQTLRRCTQLIPEGRNRLPALFKFSGMGGSTSGISATTLDEVQWWRARLSRPISTHLSPLPLQELPMVHSNVYTDASIRGVGVSIDRRWLAWRFPETLSPSPGYIGWAELIAIELALRALIAQGVTSCQIPIHIDCTEAISCLERGYSRHLDQNVVVRRIVAFGTDKRNQLEMRSCSKL